VIARHCDTLYQLWCIVALRLMITRNIKPIVWLIAVFELGFSHLVLCESRGQAASHEVDTTIFLAAEASRRQELLREIVSEPFVLEAITFESDVFMQSSEFFYLVNLREGDLIDVAALEKAVAYIRRKNKFELIRIFISDGEHGKRLHFILTGLWTLHKLKIKGILVGRETYRRYYLIEPGDRFDEQRHRDSIARISDALRQEGYFNAQVEDSLLSDKQIKAVTSTLTLSKGSRFTIGSVQLELQGFPSMKEDEIDFIRMKLNKQFLQCLQRKNYLRSMLNQETKDIKRYLLQHGFLHVGILLDEQVDYCNGRVHLTFTITLRHKREIVFFGNHFFSNNRLLDCIMVFERSVWLLPLSILTEELIKAYHDKGFWSVKIEPREEDDRVFFVITEGPRAVIKDVQLEGVDNINKRRLLQHCFRPLLRASYFDSDLLKQAFGKITAFYLKEGFWDVKVLQKRFDLINEQKHQYRIILTIDEGQRRYLTDVSIPRFPELVKKGPFKQIVSEAQKIPFDMGMLHAQKKWLEQYCKSKGMTNVLVGYDLAHDGNNIAVAWWIKPSYEGAKFGKTILLGSSGFPFEYIIRELQYHEGEDWDMQKLNRTCSRFKDLEIFETIHAYPDREFQEDKQQPIIFKLHKDDPFEVRLRAGLGIEQVSKPITVAGLTYKVGGTFIIKNPLDCCDLFCLNADVTRSSRSIVAQYRRPWFFDMPIGTVLQAYSSKYQQPGFFFCKKGLYEVSQQGMLFGFGRKYKWLDGNMTVGLEWMELDIQDEFKSVSGCVAKAIDFAPSLLHKNMPFLYVEPTLLIDLLDNKLNPIRGSLTLLSCKGMLPLTERADHAAFFKLLVEQSFFYPFMPLVLACRLRFGHIFYQIFNNINPIERFYLGGANSLRSYETDVASPLGCFCDMKGKSWWAPIGGKTMVNANFEIRLPIYGDIGVVIFQDLGALSHTGIKGFGKKGFLAGTGFGLRYNTPIGPLRFDIGWKWSVCKPFDRSYAWFLTFGNAF